MAYQKQTWEDLPSTNTPITATRLQHIEDGIKEVETGLTPAISYTETNDKGYACNYVNNNLQTKGTVLWTNSDPSNSFNSGNITLSSSDWDILEVYFYPFIGFTKMKSTKFVKGEDGFIDAIFSYNSKSYAGARNIDYVNETTLYVNNCLRVLDNSAFSSGTQNQWLIPVYIVGYKTGLSE